ncbi:MAG: hypothetical protein JXB19_05320 [Bacteroidales bacterium]|nr:hypothetical protein [Bacteroidales bacterium]
MSSIIEGYNYDIFISYRQKDNKYDGWVTEFVENLQRELDSMLTKNCIILKQYKEGNQSPGYH